MKVPLKLLLGFTVSILLFFFIGLGIYQFAMYRQYINRSPNNIVLSDITPDSVTIHWETEKESETFLKLGNSDTPLGESSSSRVHSVKLTGLEGSSKYTFKIADDTLEWNELKRENTVDYALNVFEFTTAPNTEDIVLPDTREIDMEPNTEALSVLKYGEVISSIVTVKSNRFGGAVVDNNSYLDSSLNLFYPGEETELVFLDLNDEESDVVSNRYLDMLVNKAYASEINCDQTVSSQSVNAISPDAFSALADRWVGNRGKNYAKECYNDVVYRAKRAGFDPAFALTVWLNESGASNYTQSPTNSGIIEDFGIHGNSSVPVEDFNAQINYFLKLKFQYDCEGLSYWEAWGNMYLTGNCNTDNPVQRQKGIDYYKAIEDVYKLVTNGRGLPSKINGYPPSGENNGSDDGGDSNPGWSSEGPLCCALKLDNKSDLKGDFEDNQEGKTCDDVWKVGRSVYGGKIEYSVMIEDKVGGACEVDYPGVCCNAEGKTLWYPKVACNSPLEGVSESTCKTMNSVKSYDIDLKEGINFIGLDFSPVRDTKPMLASQLFEKDPNILLVADFGTFQWKNIVKKGSEKPFLGEDFELKQGKGYLVITEKESEISLEGWKDSEVTYGVFNEGWNLVGGSLYSSYKASSLIEKLAKEEITVSTVANWNYDTSHFNYFREVEDKVYGEDMKIVNNEGVFLRK